MLTPEQKTHLDNASEPELWARLSGSSADADEAAYIRDRLVKKAQTDTLHKLEVMDQRLRAMEQNMNRSQLGAPTFWLAFLAAAFASFSVPWDLVEQKALSWQKDLERNFRLSERKSSQAAPDSPARPQVTPDLPRHSQPLPQEASQPLADHHHSSPLSDALLLLPRPGDQPRSL